MNPSLPLSRTRTRSSLLSLFLLLLTAPAHACSVCFGAQGDPQTAGMNGAILTLLGVTALVATGLSLLFFRIMRRARHVHAAYARPAATSHDIVTGPVQS